MRSVPFNHWILSNKNIVINKINIKYVLKDDIHHLFNQMQLW